NYRPGRTPRFLEEGAIRKELKHGTRAKQCTFGNPSWAAHVLSVADLRTECRGRGSLERPLDRLLHRSAQKRGPLGHAGRGGQVPAQRNAAEDVRESAPPSVG